MQKIAPDPTIVNPVMSIKKGVSGSVVAALALGVVSCFHGLTPEQSNAGTVLVIGVIESLRNVIKRKFPHIFPFF